MELFLDVLRETVVDTAKMLPFLFLAYLFIEYVETRHGERIETLLAGGGRWGEAEAPDGEKLEMTMSTPNVYALTATVGIRIAQYCLDYTGPGGYYTPSMLLGSRFIESIPGIEVHVLNQRLRKI